MTLDELVAGEDTRGSGAARLPPPTRRYSLSAQTSTGSKWRRSCAR